MQINTPMSEPQSAVDSKKKKNKKNKKKKKKEDEQEDNVQDPSQKQSVATTQVDANSKDPESESEPYSPRFEQ